MSRRWQATACVLCSQTCGIKVAVEGGHITAVRGDDADPVTRGYLCNKALQIDHYQNAPGRITTPLRRSANGTFEPISWSEAESEIASRLLDLREAHGPDCFALYGGGGQGNHLGGPFALALLGAVGSDRWFNASAQENTGEWWVNGRLFGAQSCHPTEDVGNAETVVLIGTNPWQSHVFPMARTELNRLAADPSRHLIVVDPRRTETADRADVHLQVRPGSDAFALAALLCRVIDLGGIDERFLAEHAAEVDSAVETLRTVPVAEYAAVAGIAIDDLERAAEMIVAASRVAVRDYMGVRHNRHSALSTYLARLLSILTGNVGVPGGINLHSWLYSRIRDSGDGDDARRSPVTGQLQIGGLYPPNRLPAEILNDHPARIRALVVDSANPAHTSAGSAAQRAALDALELLVVVDVAMTETARHAHYVLPAATQYEKWEMTLFTHGFPDNAIHVRPPVLPPTGEARAEYQIYGGILRAMGALPDQQTTARLRDIAEDRGAFLAALFEEVGRQPSLLPVAPVVLAETLGATLPGGAAATVPLWFACHQLVGRDPDAVRRAGFDGDGPALAEALFNGILASPSGCVFSRHTYEDMWRHIAYADGRIHVSIPELLDELRSLDPAELAVTEQFPLVLAAGQRRAWNANAIIRDDQWRRRDRHGVLLAHPDDLADAGIATGERTRVTSATGALIAVAEADDRQRRGSCVLPHGYGFDGTDGPAANELTDTDQRCPIAGTPQHKYVPVRLEPLDLGPDPSFRETSLRPATS